MILVKTPVPRSAILNLPSWVYGGRVDRFLKDADLRVQAREGSHEDFKVETVESYLNSAPNLIRWAHVDGPNVRDVLYDVITRVDDSSENDAPLAAVDMAMVRRNAERIRNEAEQAFGLNALARAFTHRQLLAVSGMRGNLGEEVAKIAASLQLIQTTETQQPTFPDAGVYLVTRSAALLHRAKLPSILLRLAHDPDLRDKGPGEHSANHQAQDMVFGSAHGLHDGFALIDTYLSPALGALSPHIWAFLAPRGTATIVFTLGRSIPGIDGIAAEPLHLIGSRGSGSVGVRPELEPASSSAALDWWCRRLNAFLSVVSDPAVYTDGRGHYSAEKHLHTLLSVDQVFRRVASMQKAYRDSDARRALFFTVMDTLQRLTGRDLTVTCDRSFAEQRLLRLRESMPLAAQRIYLPMAERAVHALGQLAGGFFLPRQLGADAVRYIDDRGRPASIPLDKATAQYVLLLRNATHGFGAKERRGRSDALLAQHNGKFPDDLTWLSWLYLLDIMAHPHELRQRLWARGSV